MPRAWCGAIALLELHDVSAPFGKNMATALAKVTASVLVLPVDADQTHSIALNEAMAKGLVNAKVTYAVLDSGRGHVRVLCGCRLARIQIRQ